MVSAYNLPFEQCPNALDSLGVQAEIADIFTGTVVHAMMRVIAAKSVEADMFVGHQSGAGRDNAVDCALHVLRPEIGQSASDKLAIAFKDTKHDSLALATLLAARSLPSVFVLFLAANESFVGFNLIL